MPYAVGDIAAVVCASKVAQVAVVAVHAKDGGVVRGVVSAAVDGTLVQDDARQTTQTNVAPGAPPVAQVKVQERCWPHVEPFGRMDGRREEAACQSA